MSIDTRPGGLDGPPAEQGRVAKVVSAVAAGFGVVAVLVAVAFMLVGMAWGIAWMLTHFPTP